MRSRHHRQHDLPGRQHERRRTGAGIPFVRGLWGRERDVEPGHGLGQHGQGRGLSGRLGLIPPSLGPQEPLGLSRRPWHRVLHA